MFPNGSTTSQRLSASDAFVWYGTSNSNGFKLDFAIHSHTFPIQDEHNCGNNKQFQTYLDSDPPKDHRATPLLRMTTSEGRCGWCHHWRRPWNLPRSSYGEHSKIHGSFGWNGPVVTTCLFRLLRNIRRSGINIFTLASSMHSPCTCKCAIYAYVYIYSAGQLLRTNFGKKIVQKNARKRHT